MRAPFLERQGYQYDYEAAEWWYECGCCGEELYAPTLNEIRYTFNQHVHYLFGDCLGGW